MLAKLTTRNQVTLPKAIIKAFKDVKHFDIETKDDYIILRPVKLSKSSETRNKLEAMGINEADIQDAIEWARK